VSEEQKRKRQAEAEAAADSFLYPGGGGIVVWVRRDELLPRASIRFRAKPGLSDRVDLVDSTILAATLRIALERIEHALADQHTTDREQFSKMVDAVRNELAPKYLAETFIKTGHQ
jgi:hypothetical protein